MALNLKFKWFSLVSLHIVAVASLFNRLISMISGLNILVVYWQNYSFIYWLIGWLVSWFVGWLVGLKFRPVGDISVLAFDGRRTSGPKIVFTDGLMDRGRGICLFEITVLSSHWLINGTTYRKAIVVEVGHRMLPQSLERQRSHKLNWSWNRTHPAKLEPNHRLELPWKNDEHEDVMTCYALHIIRPSWGEPPGLRWFPSQRAMAWWRHQVETFPRYWPFVRGFHPSFVNSPHTGQRRGALKFSLTCAWTNVWVNNRDTGN